MKVGETGIYLAQPRRGMKKAEAKENCCSGFERLGMQGWWNKTTGTF
jgi:hypothetical protein